MSRKRALSTALRWEGEYLDFGDFFLAAIETIVEPSRRVGQAGAKNATQESE